MIEHDQMTEVDADERAKLEAMTEEEFVGAMDDADAMWEAQCTPLEQEVGVMTILEITSLLRPARKLKPVGFWWTGTGSLLPHPSDLIDRSWSAKERRVVLKYLRSGRVKQRWMGSAHCRCGCKEPVLGSADMTDEVWVWPEGLTHYIEEHGVRLPAEFVNHILERS